MRSVFSPFWAILVLAVAVAYPTAAQPYLSNLNVGAADPLFATYAAPLARSEFIVDEGYHFRYYDPDSAIGFTTDHAGSLGLAFEKDGEVRYTAGAMHQPVRVTASYSDLVRYRYEPYENIVVDAHFQVYSSRLALQDIRVTNESGRSTTLTILPFLRGRFENVELSDGAIFFEHIEEPDRWMVSHGVPHVSHRRNVFLMNVEADDYGAAETMDVNLPDGVTTRDSVRSLIFRKTVHLAPGASESFRLVRGVSRFDEGLLEEAATLFELDIDAALAESERVYERIPAPDLDNPGWEAVYWSAFSLMRQVMLPPEGASSYNYYVFSREPTWGWGHGGQVFHESLTMLAYVYMDPEGAMESQRVYMERQHVDGYINYRTGSYLNEIIAHEGELTTSAPWYNWINWELYRVTRDLAFLRDAYTSGSRFYDWWLENRDKDGDGLAEWGGHAVLESVRDGYVAVWDDVAWPSHFEAIDLNSMLVKEARSLAAMAAALDDSAAAKRWTAEADRRAQAINEMMWDEETGFYYHIDAADHDFTFANPNDLKRREIIGFLPLWAGITTPDRAERLMQHLTDSRSFGRPFGVPSLAADDPYYDPMGYWNGPVWVEWQYLIFRGLLEHGYMREAADLAERVIANVSHHLKDSHTFWELYSPDAHDAGHHQTYIWTALVARMMLDLEDV